LNSPELIEVAPRNTTAERIGQVVHPVDKHRKRELLSHMVGANDWRQVLVFTRTKHGANRLAQQLESDGLRAAAIHGNKSQGARTRALADFKSGDVRVLVATDIAARGLDIDQLPHVVNYELPNVPEDYVHRIGRTGRAGNAGEAVSLVCVDELKLLRDIERLLRREIPKQVLPGYEPDPSIRAEPILNGRGSGRGTGRGDDRGSGRDRSQPQRQSEGRGRGRSSAGNRSDASVGTRYDYESGSSRVSSGSGSPGGSNRAGSQQASDGRPASKPAHGHVRRTQADTRGQPQHRHPRSGNRSPRAALVGGGFKDD
jgi:ATP-dependent RNA helicase RhlE